MPLMPRPNILFILTDQWHPRCTGYAGHPVVRTPHLDRLAQRGAVFTRMYSPQPLCMPARASILTGLTPRGHGVRMNGIPLSPRVPTFVEALRADGYRTHGVGKMHLSITSPPRGVSPDAVDPKEFPECASLWRAGKITTLPTPYHGFETVEYGTGHGPQIVGDYVKWLEHAHPDSAEKLRDWTPVEPPSPAFRLYNRQTFKWALPAAHHPTTWVVDRCIEFLRARKKEGESGTASPFFLFCSINDPHAPFAAPEPYCHRYSPAEVPPPREREGELAHLPPHFRAMVEDGIVTSGNPAEPMRATRPYQAECAAQYFGQIELIDDQVGRLLAALAASGEEKNTLVVFTADHGECLGDHGLWGKGPYHYDGVIRVPGVATWPGQIPAGIRNTAPCSLLDLAPTFLAAAGVSIPEMQPVSPAEAPAAPSPWPGMNLLPVLAGKQELQDRAVLVEMDEDYLGLRLRTLVTRRHRLTTYAEKSYGELFDLENDPDEFTNLWDKPEAQELKARLGQRLLHEIIRTDPVLPRQLARA